MSNFPHEPMSDCERAWLAEYEMIEADILATAERPLPGPLVVKMAMQRMGYRHPSRGPRKEA